MCTQLLVLHMHNEVLLKRSLDLLFTWSYSQAPTQPSIVYITKSHSQLPCYKWQKAGRGQATSVLFGKDHNPRREVYYYPQNVNVMVSMMLAFVGGWVCQALMYNPPPPPPPPHPQPKRDTTIILGICCNILGWAWTPDKACYGAIHETHSIDFNTRK